MPETRLPYRILDADNHFNEPRNCFDGYIDPAKLDLAIRWAQDENGREVQLFAGKPSRFSVEQITYSRDELESMLGTLPNLDEDPATTGVVPGMLLNRLNPLRGLSDAERIEMVAELRNQHEACGSRELRLALMDEQGIEAARCSRHGRTRSSTSSPTTSRRSMPTSARSTAGCTKKWDSPWSSGCSFRRTCRSPIPSCR